MSTDTLPRKEEPKTKSIAATPDNSSRLEVFVNQYSTVLIYPEGRDLGKRGYGHSKAIYIFDGVDSERVRDAFLQQAVAKQRKQEVITHNEIFELAYKLGDLPSIYAAAERLQREFWND